MVAENKIATNSFVLDLTKLNTRMKTSSIFIRKGKDIVHRNCDAKHSDRSGRTGMDGQNKGGSTDNNAEGHRKAVSGYITEENEDEYAE